MGVGNKGVRSMFNDYKCDVSKAKYECSQDHCAYLLDDNGKPKGECRHTSKLEWAKDVIEEGGKNDNATRL